MRCAAPPPPLSLLNPSCSLSAKKFFASGVQKSPSLEAGSNGMVPPWQCGVGVGWVAGVSGWAGSACPNGESEPRRTGGPHFACWAAWRVLEPTSAGKAAHLDGCNLHSQALHAPLVVGRGHLLNPAAAAARCERSAACGLPHASPHMPSSLPLWQAAPRVWQLPSARAARTPAPLPAQPCCSPAEGCQGTATIQVPPGAN